MNTLYKSCDECGGTKYDDRCWNSDKHDPHGGLGCNGCGKPKCRFCDENPDSHWISCSTIPDITTTSTTTTSQ